MEDDVLDLIAEKRVYVVPTIAIYREQYRGNDMNRILIQKRGWTVSLHETLFKKARARKITMGVGTGMSRSPLEFARERRDSSAAYAAASAVSTASLDGP